MKLNLQEKNELLFQPSSPYYCGSSCLLSLYVIIQAIRDSSNKDLSKELVDLQGNILSLFDEDTALFDLSKKQDFLMEEEWKQVLDALDEYAMIISFLTQLEDVCFSTDKKRYLSHLHHAKLFLIELAKMNLSIFEVRDDKPYAFGRISNDVFAAIKKGNQYEIGF